MKYRIFEIATASRFLGEVEAYSEKEAIEKGWDKKHPDGSIPLALCHSCARKVEIGDTYEIQAEEIEE